MDFSHSRSALYLTTHEDTSRNVSQSCCQEIGVLLQCALNKCVSDGALLMDVVHLYLSANRMDFNFSFESCRSILCYAWKHSVTEWSAYYSGSVCTDDSKRKENFHCCKLSPNRLYVYSPSGGHCLLFVAVKSHF